MNTIKIIQWNIVQNKWLDWKDFKESDTKSPIKIDINEVYLELNGLKNLENEVNFAFYQDDKILGCVTIFIKEAPRLSIGGIGRMAVDPEYRYNGISSYLMEICILYMHRRNINISILWASVLKVYEKFGYIAIKDNMMYRPICGLPLEYNMDRVRELPSIIGVF